MDHHLISEQKKQRSVYLKTICTIAAVVLVATIALLNLFTHLLPVVRYYGDGMEPTLSSGQLLMVAKTDKVSEGDVVAFYYNNKVLVRRVIGTGGNRIEIGRDGVVSVNGSVLEESYVKELSIGQCNLGFPHYVAPNHVFVMGDNRVVAMDSRLKEIGDISLDRIIGKVLFLK